MPDITLKIDDREVTVAQGTTILKAAEALGIVIPTFCYHHGLSIAANCRMCLVETNKAPKLLPACHAQVMAGMEVRTQSPRVKAARRGILEFILIQHPVDCPICDQSGECELQDHYRNYSLESSRLDVAKLHKPKAAPFGPHVIYDGERCILCTRCVRFVQEISKSHELTVIHRGEKAEIATFPDRPLNNPYSMCTADLCPVGALTTIPFRFRARVWWLKTTPSVCTHCARHCSIHIDIRRNEVLRLRPRYNAAVNHWWMCDEGRLSFAAQQSGRLSQAIVRHDRTTAKEVTTREGVAAALQILARFKAQSQPPAVLLSADCSNESAFVALRLAREVLQTKALYMASRPDGFHDDILIRADKNANRTGLQSCATALWPGQTLGDLGQLDADARAGRFKSLLVFGGATSVTDRALECLEAIVAIVTHVGPWTEHATVALPATTLMEQEGSVTNFDGHVQRLRAAVHVPPHVHPFWRYVCRLAAGLGASWSYGDAAAIFADLAAKVPAFAGLTSDSLGADGLPGGGARTPEPPTPTAAPLVAAG